MGVINVIKKHIKHMFSDKVEKNIVTRTKALAGIQEVASTFDETSNVIKHCRHHTVASSHSDEATIIRDLRALRPFEYEAGRAHASFPHIPCSVLDTLEATDTRSWIEYKQYHFAMDLGN